MITYEVHPRTHGIYKWGVYRIDSEDEENNEPKYRNEVLKTDFHFRANRAAKKFAKQERKSVKVEV
jgi:hypothetical protein